MKLPQIANQDWCELFAALGVFIGLWAFDWRISLIVCGAALLGLSLLGRAKQ